jgi:hypothetical protein
MSTELSNIHFEGATILRVIEDADRHMLIFEVSYPMPEGGSDFPRRRLFFQNFSRYVVDESRVRAGEPTIQRVEVMPTEPDRATIRMHTDHGVREVTCHTCVLDRVYESAA